MKLSFVFSLFFSLQSFAQRGIVPYYARGIDYQKHAGYIVLNNGQQDSIFLKLNLARGDKFEYSYTVLDTVAHKEAALSFIFGGEPKTTEEQLLKALMTVSDIDPNNNYILTAEYTQRTLQSKMPLIGEVDYNSDSLNSNKKSSETTTDEIYKAEFSAYVHHSFTIIVSSSGKIISVTGIDKILKAFENNIENSPHLSDSQKKDNIEDLRKNLSNESIKRAMDADFNVYPNTSVAIGSEWQKEVITGIYEPEDDIYHYQLKNIRNDSLFINEYANVNSPGDTARDGTPAKMTGILSGTMIVDKRSGVMLQKLVYVQTKGTTVEGRHVLKLSSSSLEKTNITRKTL